jgi:7-keto-8-aminopelargonate synthetase-like enzyme
MGTLSKTFASVGGYIAGNAELIEILKHYAPGFVFSVGLPPAMSAAALTALRVIKREPERVARLHKNGTLFLREARENDLDTGRSLGFGMLPVMVGASSRVATLVHRLYARGINTSLIIYPGVPLNAGRLRFFLTSELAPAEIRLAVQTTSEEIEKV